MSQHLTILARTGGKLVTRIGESKCVSLFSLSAIIGHWYSSSDSKC